MLKFVAKFIAFIVLLDIAMPFIGVDVSRRGDDEEKAIDLISWRVTVL